MEPRRYTRAAKATVICAVVLLGQAGVGPAGATDVRCGSIITTDTTLTHDIIGCKKAVALSIGADNVTLDLGGFTVAGLRDQVRIRQTGIATQGHSGVVVANGKVTNFHFGVDVSGPDQPLDDFVNTADRGGTGNIIRGIVAKANGVNIDLWDTRNSTVSDSKMVDGRSEGIRIFYGGNNSILRNKIHNNGEEGVAVDFSGGNLIEGNTITYNDGDGVRTIPSITVRNNTISNNGLSGVYQYPHGQNFRSAMTITGNLICSNAHGGIVMTAEGHTITDNNVGAGTPECLRNGWASGYDLFDGEAAQEDPEDVLAECRSTWRNNYTEGDTFNHPCVTK